MTKIGKNSLISHEHSMIGLLGRYIYKILGFKRPIFHKDKILKESRRKLKNINAIFRKGEKYAYQSSKWKTG